MKKPGKEGGGGGILRLEGQKASDGVPGEKKIMEKKKKKVWGERENTEKENEEYRCRAVMLWEGRA